MRKGGQEEENDGQKEMDKREYEDDQEGSLEYPVCHLGAGNLFFSCMEYILLFLPVCYDYGISLSGMWAFKGGLFYSEGESFCRHGTCIRLSMELVYWRQFL